jgi:hydrogenase nickel incorporation protein HypA/HybF
MHELGITEQLLSLALRHAEQAGATRITALYLSIGEFSSVIDESLQFYWGMIAKGTIAEDAVLQFRRIQGMLRCTDCNTQGSIHEFENGCPGCGGIHTMISDGTQFHLESIEIEGLDGK